MTIRRRILFAFAALTVCLLAGWYWLLHTNSGATWVLRAAGNATQQHLDVGNVQGDFAGGVRLSEVRWESTGVTIAIKKAHAIINVDILPPGIEVASAILSDTSASVVATEKEGVAPTSVREILEALVLPLPVRLSNVEFDGIDLRAEDGERLRVDKLRLQGEWQETIAISELTVQAPQLQAELQGELELLDQHEFRLDLLGVAEDAEIRLGASGVLDRYDLTIDAQYDEQAMGRLLVAAVGSGDLTSLDMQRLTISGEHLAATGTLGVSWDGAVSGNAILDIAKLNLAKLTNAWPATHPLHGKLQLQIDEHAVVVSDSSVRVMSTDTEVQVDASFDRLTQNIAADLRWAKLGWPIDASSPRIMSERADVTVSGSIDDWTVSGAVDLATALMPDGSFQLNGNGDRDQLLLQIQNGQVFGGTVAGRSKLSWRDSLAWSADVSVLELQTRELAPQFPGVVSGRVTAVGTGRPFSIDAHLQDVSGELLRRKLSAAGHVAYTEAGLSARNLVVEHGRSNALLNGALESERGLTFELDVAALESYTDKAAGGFSSSGVVSGASQNPFVSVSLSSDRIRVGDLVLNDVRVSDERETGELAALAITAVSLEIDDSVVDDAELQLSFAADRQSLTVSGKSVGSSFVVGAGGGFSDWREPWTSAWRGDIDEFSLDLSDQYRFRLQAPAQLQVRGKEIDLRPLCLASSAGESLCAEFSQSGFGDLQIGAQLTDVPLALLNLFVRSGLLIEQRLSGSLDLSRDRQQRVTGKGNFALSPGRISSAADPEVGTLTSAGHLDFEMREGRLLSGALAIPMSGTDSIKGNFEIEDVRNMAESEIDGELSVSMENVEVLAFFAPWVDSVKGKLAAELELSGTASEPLMTGRLDLEDGGFAYRPIGLQLEDIQLDGVLTSSRALELSGRFRAGEGSGEIVSSADYSDVAQPGLRFKLRGSDLLLVDVPDIRVTVQPDIELAVTRQNVEINGSLLVPFARIAPSNLAESRDDESEDVVIVAGTLPEAEQKPAVANKRLFSGSLEVELGEQIVVDLEIAKAKVVGAAVFNWQGPPVPQATGRYDLTGSIEAYGQVLDIAEGGIRYLNGPADNPSVRLRAEREIYGNAQVKRAGVMVSGEARRPVVEAYTVPQTTEERALTLLVTGSDFDYEQGVGALDFGTYIGPRLFISYGVGIFDQENVISARYDLAKGFGVKATSGRQESGVDLNYRIEN
ncbi:MAG: translocation/assembly module TamB domain-containing protein [Gammaproteobacteria bacterium]|nr:translocation/assembly module TamB domain-containing protein [Gammaproteobacteria bacterium]